MGNRTSNVYEEKEMSVSSISSNSALTAQLVKQQSETGEATRAGRDVRPDGDGDDGGGAKQPAPVVNSSGQTTGTIINTKA